jgi:hypothetical protein
MEGLRFDSASCRYIASRLGEARFTLVDIGCSGGIDSIWRLFGPRLRAFGFDPRVEECARLNAAETLPGVRYVPAFVGVPADHPAVTRRGSRPHVQRNPWNRLSTAHSMAFSEARVTAMNGEEITSRNLWTQTRLADASAPVVLSDFFREHAVDDIDLLKIDIDGPDFEVLQSIAGDIRDLGVLAVGMEVNFTGSHEDTDHTFHNTDRFMRELGFDLFGLTVRPYSLAALPARYQLTVPAQTESGRPVQGDALYVLDLGDPARGGAAHVSSPAKLAKLCAIYACFGLRDCAAEVLLTYRDRLADLLEVDEVLNLLAEEAQGRKDGYCLSYAEYLAAFERDEPLFYPGEPKRRASVAPARTRIVCTVPPKDWFGGHDYQGAKGLTDALAHLDCDVFLLDIDCFFQQDAPRIQQSLRRLREFRPDVAISTPNAGYALSVKIDVAGAPANVFTDYLGIPLALCWDDPLGQFSGQFLSLPSTPDESRPGALQRIRAGVNQPLLFHYGWDTGHIKSMEDLELLRQGAAVFDIGRPGRPYLDWGRRHGISTSFDRDICFAGNVYLNQITASPLHQIPEIARMVDRITERKLADFRYSAWEFLIDEIQQLSDAELLRLKLLPDQTFFWQVYRYVVWVAVNTRVRMGVLSAVARPVDFYGGFADPEGIGLLQTSANIRYRGTADYVNELPGLFHRSKITIDVANQLAQRSVPGKFFECFAAGGFMLIDRRPDLVAAFGDAAHAVTYETIEELNAKIEYFLTNESDRRELIGYFQDRIQRDHSPQAWLSRIVADLRERAEARPRAKSA